MEQKTRKWMPGNGSNITAKVLKISILKPLAKQICMLVTIRMVHQLIILWASAYNKVNLLKVHTP